MRVRGVITRWLAAGVTVVGTAALLAGTVRYGWGDATTTAAFLATLAAGGAVLGLAAFAIRSSLVARRLRSATTLPFDVTVVDPAAELARVKRRLLILFAVELVVVVLFPDPALVLSYTQIGLVCSEAGSIRAARRAEADQGGEYLATAERGRTRYFLHPR